MGLPLGPTFANIFMCHYEKKWLDSCPPDFAPLFYRRYVDDCFLLFNSRSYAASFLSFLNSRHKNVKFTMENESNGQLPFLDVLVRKEGGKLHTSVYMKPSFSGLGTSFFSFVSKPLKFSAISSAIFRAYNISSTYSSFHIELEFIKKFFRENGFLFRIVDSLTRALEGGLRITPSGGGGGHIMPPPSISAPMRASATNFGGYLGPY